MALGALVVVRKHETRSVRFSQFLSTISPEHVGQNA
jgi:hypothetical protein